MKRYTLMIKGGLLLALLILTVVVVIKISYEFVNRNPSVDTNTYQAVFLDNNQIYFGQLSHLNSNFPVLNDVYYVQITDESNKSGKVVPLGDTEPHRPKNQMILNKDHILFIENLKSDSPVIKAIQNLKSQHQ